MAKRSIKASSAGIITAKRRFERTGWTQEYLAAEVGLSTRQSIWKFFSGRPIDRHLFIEICFKLNLEWEEIADLPENKLEKETTKTSPPKSPPNENLGIEELVEKMRSHLQEKILNSCNTLQSSLDLTQPLSLEQVYTNLNLIPQLSHERWLEVEDLQKTPGNFNDNFNRLYEEREAKPAMEVVAQHSKLIILGKPGAGKTTFLQNLALQCNQGLYKNDCVPILIKLRTFIAEVENKEDFSLSKYIINLGVTCGLFQEQSQKILEAGKALILLDGLDEITQENKEKIIQEIDKLAQTYFNNQIIITSRLGAEKYYFKGFTYVELADFNQTQVEAFVKKWFVATANTETEGLKKAEKFLQQLNLQTNLPIRDLVVTPILLNLICSVFKERATFPTKRAKLYQVGLDILLEGWDQARGVERDEIYRKLSLADKIKLLCEIAATNFEQGNYFFEKSELIFLIEDYLCTLPDASEDPETLWLNAEAVLKAIESQHGLLVEQAREVYSFSHLTFQEYLTARKFVATPRQDLPAVLTQLGSYTLDNRWREVILLTVSMLHRADFLLQEIKKQVDGIVNQDEQLAQFITLINQKVDSLKISGKKAAIRAFYLTLFEYNRDLNLANAIDENLVSYFPPDLKLDLALSRCFAIGVNLVKKFDIESLLNLFFALEIEKSFQLEQELKQAIKALKSKLPDLETGIDNIQCWWEENGENWLNQFRSLLIEQRQIGHNWQRTQQQQELWEQYYQANLFLVECLKSECQVSPKVRAEIEQTLLSM